ncbi:hypothetical protein Tco_0910807 [Tanacetum coccineum]|uniref:Uncharacterized protein n=1 Tax=Tanacetum coccineum TaxID=301880 RepID=A0ABQ5CVL7_9ASTR
MLDYEDEDTTVPIRSASLPPLPLFEEMEHGIGIPQDDIGSSQITRLQLRAVAAEQQATDLQDSHVTNRLDITELRNRVKYAETRLERSHVRQTGDRVCIQRDEMTEHDVEALHARAEVAEQRAETLHISLGAAQMDIIDLLESRRADRLEMAEL